jgi:HK97 family phage prohead protease
MTFKVCVKSLFTPLEEGSIEGYASVFGGVDSYGDTIEKTAFDNVIKSGQKPLMFYQHNRWSIPIGVWEELSVDEKGLKVKGRLNLELEEAREVYSALKFGSLNGMSIGFRMKDKDYEYDDDDICHIKNISELLEISIVNFPADKEARIDNVKSEDRDLNDIRDCEHYLRELGISKKMAQKLISVIKTAKSAVSDSQKSEDAKLAAELEKIQQKLNHILRK